MSRFGVRQGVFLVELKGTYLLVCDKDARKECLYVRRINETAAALWNMIQDGFSFDEIIKVFMERYDIDDPERLKDDIRLYLKQLEEKGYIYPEGAGGEQFG